MDFWVEIRPLERPQGLNNRQAEGVVWRAIVREKLGTETTIGYNDRGAPVVDCGYISISHTADWVAVVWSPRPCAIDIEKKTRTISEGVKKRYGIERIEDWCALEAEYKYEGLTGTKPTSEVMFLPHDLLVVAVYV